MNPGPIRHLCRRLWLGLLLIFSPAAALAGTSSAWLTRTWQTEEGLPNNYVTSIAQTPDGYLWVATHMGLTKFDGVRFTKFPFRPGNESDYQNQGARRIVPGKNGGLWITPIRGPAVYVNPDHTQVSTPETGLPPGTSPYTSVEDNDGAFWIATGDAIVRLANGKATRFGEPEGVPRGTVYALTPDSAGNVWLAKGSIAQGSSLAVFKEGRFEIVTLVKGVARVAPALTNGVWIVNREHLYKCDLAGHLRDFGPFQPDNPAAEISAVMEDHAGAVWIGTDGNGLIRHSGSGNEPVDTSYPRILSLAEDGEKNLWAGTAGGGLNRISPRGVRMESFESGTTPAGIQSVSEDADGVLWGMTQSGLAVCRRDGKWQLPFTNVLETATCVVADHSGSVWISTRNSPALYRWHDQQLTRLDASNGLTFNAAAILLPGSDGGLWIGTYRNTSVQYLHEGVFRTLTVPQGIGRIDTMVEDAHKSVWVGTDGGFLLRVDGNQLVDETGRTGVSKRGIRSLYATPDNALWIGYAGWGLGRLRDGHFAHIDSTQGLPDEYISHIVADDQGWLWFGCADHGIFKIRRQQLEQAMADNVTRLRPILYGRNEGLASTEAIGSSPGALRSQDGRLWFPMRAALAVVDPEILRENPEPPAVLLTQVVLDGRTIASYGGVAFTQHLANLKALDTPLRLPPGHRRLEIGFTAFNFTAPENVHLQYQMEPVDNDWADAEPQRSARYSRLAAGDYRFRVRACNADGLWNESAVPLGFIVTPFVWQRWWFRLGAVCLFTFSLIGVVRYISFRRLKSELRALELQATLDKERTRIARDLHDDLGCSLTHVALVLEMNEQKSAAPGTANGKTQLCSPMVRQVVKSVDEIIWAINPRNDQLQYLFDYIIEFAVEFLHAAGIRPQVDMPDRIPDLAVSPEVRHNLFLVVKEALNNAVRHAQATEVRFHITTTESGLDITIQDNGRGFAQAPDNATADGLRNMRQRMEEIGGRFQIESKPGDGTKVSLSYAWPKGQ